MHKHPSISIIICTYNGAARIEKVLSCFKKQKNTEHIDWEIIVVDNNSTDNTYEIVKNISSEFGKKLKLVQETKQGLIHARIKGYHASRCDVISYIDDDNYVADDWVFNVYDIMKTYPEVGACGGFNKLYIDDPQKTPSWFHLFQDAYAVGPQSHYTSGTVDHLWGAGLSLRKNILDILFSQKYQLLLTGRTGSDLASGEDSEIVYATRILGWKLYYSEALKLEHHMNANRLTLSYLESLFKAFGKSQIYIVPYLSYLNNTPSLKNFFRYNQSWIFPYMQNLFKIGFYSIYYYFSYFKNDEKSLHPKLILISLVSFNKMLYRKRKTYKDIFTSIKKLLLYSRSNHVQ